MNVSAWRLSLDMLPRICNLDRRVMGITSMLCVIYDDRVESVNHFLFPCVLAMPSHQVDSNSCWSPSIIYQME